jgi:formamidopyrimidine-DNA glycosylase
MPELPEVEAVLQTIRPFVEGRRVVACRVLHPIAVRPSSGSGAKRVAAMLARTLPGRTIVRAERHGKYLALILDRGVIVMHFRLDGQLLWFDSAETTGHVDVALQLGTGTLGFVDPRHFGRFQLEESIEQAAGIRDLGIDPLSDEFTAERFTELLGASARPLKLFLLDQDKVAGIGNIYSNEAMWHARLSPLRRANDLNEAEARRLHKSVVDVLGRALECCLHPAPDFRDANWWFQGLEKILRVYGREGKKCRRCGGTIARTVQGGRSTFWCKRCQK